MSRRGAGNLPLCGKALAMLDGYAASTVGLSRDGSESERRTIGVVRKPEHLTGGTEAET